MLGSGDELLRKLSGAARSEPAVARGGTVPGDAGVGFASLLRAKGRSEDDPIEVAQDVEFECDEALRRRLGRAADRGAARGLACLAAVVPGGVVRIDAGRRMVVGWIGPVGDEPVEGIDGLVVMGPEGDEAAGAQRIFGVGLHGRRPCSLGGTVEPDGGGGGSGVRDQRRPVGGPLIAISLAAGQISAGILALFGDRDGGSGGGDGTPGGSGATP
ncbi:MAG: hypothetical protein ACTS3F_07020 [Phycisphaerales bacterium]